MAEQEQIKHSESQTTFSSNGRNSVEPSIRLPDRERNDRPSSAAEYIKELADRSIGEIHIFPIHPTRIQINPDYFHVFPDGSYVIDGLVNRSEVDKFLAGKIDSYSATAHVRMGDVALAVDYQDNTDRREEDRIIAERKKTREQKPMKRRLPQ